MRYTITTRATRHGIGFSRDELRPIGVTDKSLSLWGVWVEARNIDWECKYNSDFCSEVQAPHMVIAPIHPNLWPTAFSIEVLVQRRKIDKNENPARSDAVFGLSDALNRFGVNILFVQTAQIGYDLLVYSATCDMPSLRDLTRKQLRLADTAGRDLAHARERLFQVKRSEASDEATVRAEELAFRDQEAKTEQARINASRMLGSRLLPRLSELTAKLTLLDELRHQFDALTRSPGSEANETQLTRLLALAQHDHFFRLIVGNDVEPKGLSPEERKDRFRESLAASWFFNNKCRVAGENMYFLDYDSFKDRNTIRERRALVTIETDAMSPARDENESLNLLYGRVFEVLRQPTPSGFPESILRESATAQRVATNHDADQFEASMLRDLVFRQSYCPVRIVPLSSLAHARFWHFVRRGKNHGMVEFHYKNHMITPNGHPHRAGAMHDIFGFLNLMCGLDLQAERRGRHYAKTVTNALALLQDLPVTVLPGSLKEDLNVVASSLTAEATTAITKFGPETAVFGTIDQQDRFLRLRFELPDRESESFLHVEIEHDVKPRKTEHDAKPGVGLVNSRGLLADTLAFFMRKGLRPERADNVMQEIRVGDDLGDAEIDTHQLKDQAVGHTESREAGTLLITLKAFVKQRSDLAARNHKYSTASNNAEKREREVWNRNRYGKGNDLPPEEEAGLDLIKLINGFVDPSVWHDNTRSSGEVSEVRDWIVPRMEDMWKRQFDEVRPGCVIGFRIHLGVVPPRRMGG